MYGAFAFESSFDEDTCSFLVERAKQPDIDGLVYPEEVDTLTITGDYFYHLRVPEGVKTLVCSGVGLTALELPDSIEAVYIDNNKLSRLEVPNSIVRVIANNNLIEELVFRGGDPYKLEDLELKGNRLSTLDFNPPPTLENIRLYPNWHMKDVNPGITKIINERIECSSWNTPSEWRCPACCKEYI